VRERLVGLGHLVRVLALLDRVRSPFAAAKVSAASFSAIDFSLRSREYEINQRIANAVRRSGRTSTGTW